MKNPAPPPLRGDATRDALIEAATHVFARDRFGSANLRDIARRAGVNAALIGYHFRNKEGLYLAVFERMAGQLQAAIGPALAEMQRALDDHLPPEACLEAILGFLDHMLVHLLQENPAWGELFVRELQAPTAAFEILHKALMLQAATRIIQLLERLRPQDPPQRLRLLAGSVITQVAVIRISRTPIMRLMGWESIGDTERAAMQAMIRRNTTLIVHGD